ncbi:hypothetical protein C8N36_102390 [Pelagimonas varians]|uniref:Uncharacterized protein n=1 Tax=Pelagimonas varians TaxID=696760 RepID=A0A238K282_9RHOB|nr:hypothetical protein C8N36_102390 [Pelagimonas varians]SMX36567.1 hypothetical protein PEV8663_00851 [Pelagimonas varians]
MRDSQEYVTVTPLFAGIVSKDISKLSFLCPLSEVRSDRFSRRIQSGSIL